MPGALIKVACTHFALRTAREGNNWNSGRGVYFEDPNGHILELMSRTETSGS